MLEKNQVAMVAMFAVVLLAGCAVSPEAEEQRRLMEEEISSILAEPLDEQTYGTAKRCLSDAEYHHLRIIDDRRILFEGRGDRLWLNTLRSRCPDLRHYSVIITRPISPSRMCEMDLFYVSDWFAWPWYRRWPWYWGWGWGASASCMLGEFQPVTEDQVERIEETLKRR